MQFLMAQVQVIHKFLALLATFSHLWPLLGLIKDLAGETAEQYAVSDGTGSGNSLIFHTGVKKCKGT